MKPDKLKYLGLFFLIMAAIFSGGASSVSAAPLVHGNRTMAVNASLNWAGYTAAQGKFTGVGASWIVPKVKPNKNFKTDAAWVGIGGVNSADLIQAGTEAITGQAGRVSYRAWFEMLPNFSRPLPVAVNSGDLVSVSIEQRQADKWLISFVNNSSGQKFRQYLNYKSSLSSAEWIEEMPSDTAGLIPLDNFGKVQFSSAYAIKNGKRVSIAGAEAQDVAIVSPAGRILAVPSSLKAGGGSFQVKRLNGAA